MAILNNEENVIFTQKILLAAATAEEEQQRLLVELSRYFNGFVPDEDLIDINGIKFNKNNINRIRNLIVFKDLGLPEEVTNIFRNKWIIPGLSIPAPLPIGTNTPTREQIIDYENYLFRFYDNYGAKDQFIFDENGMRRLLPHEKYVYDEKGDIVDSITDPLSNAYYSAYVNSRIWEIGRTDAPDEAPTTPEEEEDEELGRETPPIRRERASEREEHGETAPSEEERESHTEGRRRVVSRTRRRRKLGVMGLLAKFDAKLDSLDKTLITPEVLANIKKIIKWILIIGAAALVLGVAIPALGGGIGGILASFGKQLAGPYAGKLIVQMVISLAGLAGFFALLVASVKRKKGKIKLDDGEDETEGEREGEEAPTESEEHEEIPSFDSPEEFIEWIQIQINRINSELNILDMRERDLKNPGPISPEDQASINEQRAALKENLRKCQMMMLKFRAPAPTEDLGGAFGR